MTTLADLGKFMADEGYEFFNMSSNSKIGATIILRASRKRQPSISGHGPTLDAAFADLKGKTRPKPDALADLLR